MRCVEPSEHLDAALVGVSQHFGDGCRAAGLRTRLLGYDEVTEELRDRRRKVIVRPVRRMRNGIPRRQQIAHVDLKICTHRLVIRRAQELQQRAEHIVRIKKVQPLSVSVQRRWQVRVL